MSLCTHGKSEVRHAPSQVGRISTLLEQSQHCPVYLSIHPPIHDLHLGSTVIFPSKLNSVAYKIVTKYHCNTYRLRVSFFWDVLGPSVGPSFRHLFRGLITSELTRSSSLSQAAVQLIYRKATEAAAIDPRTGGT